MWVVLPYFIWVTVSEALFWVSVGYFGWVGVGWSWVVVYGALFWVGGSRRGWVGVGALLDNARWISMKKNWDIDWFILEILMIKESCSLIGWIYISIYNLKLCAWNWRKTLCFIQNQSIFLSKLLLIWLYPREQLSLGRLGFSWPSLAMPNQKHELESFPSLVTVLCRKSKRLIDSLQT